MSLKEPIFMSDGEVDPVSEIKPPEPPRVVQDTFHPVVLLIALMLLSWGVLGLLWLLASWILALETKNPP